MSNKKKVIAWDFDDTLGKFKALAYFLEQNSDNIFVDYFYDSLAMSEDGFGFVEGMRSLLSRLSSRGYFNVITTWATRDYVDASLVLSGGRNIFDDVFDRENCLPEVPFGKRYKHLLKKYDLTRKTAEKDLLIIGDDLKRDLPVDLEKVVFVHHPYSSKAHADLLEGVIDLLDLSGHGNFFAGFNQLLSKCLLGNDGRKHYFTEEGVDLKLYVKRCMGKEIPVMSISMVPEYFRSSLEDIKRML
ncbi:hypothetical protein DRJ25_02980 [Candidatus Woesearchaeota archaeon]|nr:MAG: hypothetical protein DRJ25_02980 [Candidatus Woesearchaeota archaeon]